jgi:glycosyltransferase involved in cell wall biosynthesis
VKILQVIARVNRGGTARWLEELVTGLRSKGHEVLLAAGHVQNGEIEDEIFENLGGYRIESLGRSISIFSDLKALSEVRKFIVECKPDLINTHTAKAGAIGRLAAISILKNRPAIVHTYHGHLLYGYFPKWKSRFFNSIEIILAKVSDILIAAGDKVKSDLLAAGVGNEHLFIVSRPGIQELEHFDKQIIREKLGIPNSRVVVGWLGRMTKIKRADRAVALAKVFPEVVFLLGGEGELLEELKATAPTNVLFLGWTEPEIIWSASDIALLTSDNEAQPIALIEAGLSGIPAIAENVGSVSEVIKKGETGFLVSGSQQRIEALNQLSSDPSLALEMGMSAKKYCESEFGLQQFLDSHLTAYSKALRLRS